MQIADPSMNASFRTTHNSKFLHLFFFVVVIVVVFVFIFGRQYQHLSAKANVNQVQLQNLSLLAEIPILSNILLR